MNNPNRPTPPPIPGNMQNRQTPPPLRQQAPAAPQQPMGQPAPVQPGQPRRPLVQKSESNTGARAAAAVVAGIAGFGAAAAAAAYLGKDDIAGTTVAGETSSTEEGGTLGTSSVDGGSGHSHGFALSSQDGVPAYGGSFAEAFAAARHDLGAGGVFEWNGKLYGTYTIDEWNSMSAGERDQYWAHVGNLQGEDYSGNYATVSDGEPIVDPESGLTFDEAFAEARSQVGAGSVFEWNGRYYGTFTKEEWDAMSPEDRMYWHHSSDYQIKEGMAYHPGVNEYYDEAAPSGDDIAYVEGNETNSNDGHMGKSSYVEGNEGGEDDGELRILNTSSINVDGQEMSVMAIGTGSDDMAVFVDVDNDGVLDLMVMDENGDGVLQDEEYSNISDLGLTGRDIETVISGGTLSQSNETVVEEPSDEVLYEVYDENAGADDAINVTPGDDIALNTDDSEIDAFVPGEGYENDLAFEDPIDDMPPEYVDPGSDDLAFNDPVPSDDFGGEIDNSIDDQPYMAYDDMNHDGMDGMDDFDSHFDDSMLS